jgi:hypothetical protein
MDPNIKQSVIDRLKQTNNVLVTVKNNPNIDELSACIGFTLFLNKLGKHATAVFSGEVPSLIEFLKPEYTLECNTDSLRDFIIALDKSKADKLRYKVEDKVVKIYITPYKTSLSQEDLEFSQGDFNVDVVVALGVHKRDELDQAITAHGRILHDATIISVNNTKPADLGALNWNDSKASSLSEMLASLVDLMQPNSYDNQIATAFLAGIVSETDRFSNTKTTSATMSLSAKLMAAGANQQLVASKLQEPVQTLPEAPSVSTSPTGDVGATSSTGSSTLEISHQKNDPNKDKSGDEKPKDNNQENSDERKSDEGEIFIDEDGNLIPGLHDQDNKEKPEPKPDDKPSKLAVNPPSMGGTLSASTLGNQLDPSIDPLSGKMGNQTMLNRESTGTQSKNIKSPDLNPISDNAQENEMPNEDEANGNVSVDMPISQLESQVGRSDNQNKTEEVSIPPSTTGIEDARKAIELAAQQNINSSDVPNQAEKPNDNNDKLDQTPIGNPPEQANTQSPPPVPPPMMPPNYNPPGKNDNSFDVPL